MKSYLTGLKNALIIRGILAILFGLFALLMPGITLHLFIMAFGIFTPPPCLYHEVKVQAIETRWSSMPHYNHPVRKDV